MPHLVMRAYYVARVVEVVKDALAVCVAVRIGHELDCGIHVAVPDQLLRALGRAVCLLQGHDLSGLFTVIAYT